MGMFDSYRVSWADGELEIQTKQTDCFMDSWLLGDAAPFPSDPDRSLASGHLFWSLLESSSLERGWHDPSAERHFSLFHFNGVFCDFVGGLDEDEALASGALLREIWADPAWRAEGFSRLLALSRRREAYRSSLAMESLALGRDWLSWQEELRSPPSASPGRRLGALFRHDFSKQPLDSALSALAEKPVSLPSFYRVEPTAPRSGDPAEPDPPVSGERLGFFRSAEPPPPAFPPGKNPIEASWLALRSARLDALAGILASDPSPLEDAAFASALSGSLRRACCSRLFAPDAAALMARTGFFPQSLGPEGFEAPVLDWLAGRVGLQSPHIQALLAAGAPPSAQTPFFFLYGYSGLLAESLGGRPWPEIEDAAGWGLLQRAVRAESPEALSILLSLGAPVDAPSSKAPRPLILALEHCKRRWSPAMEHLRSAGRMSSEARCVFALIDAGADISRLKGEPDPRSLFTPEIAEAFAEGERRALAQMPSPIPSGSERRNPRGV